MGGGEYCNWDSGHKLGIYFTGRTVQIDKVTVGTVGEVIGTQDIR